MGLFDHFPYTNFHDLNLDWILKMLQEIDKTMDKFVAINALKYADPIQWNITSQYEKNTIVIDPQTGTAYISVQPVPIGVSLSNTDYWTVVFDLGSFVVKAAKNFANTYEEDTTLTATVPTSAGGWLVWGDTLYIALVNITAGDSYVIDGNIRHFTIEDIVGNWNDLDPDLDPANIVAAINSVYVLLNAVIGSLYNLSTSDKSSIVSAINELYSSISNLTTDIANVIGDLDNLTTTDKSSIVNAINELVSSITTLDTAVGNLADLNTTDKSSIVNAINELKGIVDTFVINDYRFITNSSGAVNNIIATALTYIKNAGSLTYGNLNGAFNDICTNEIDCSTLVQLCLMGTSYEDSRYVGSTNISYLGYDFTDQIIDPSERPFGMLANQLCQYADEHGFGYQTDDITQIEAGDILFVANSPNPDYYKSIGHCALVISKNPYNGLIRVIESTSTTPCIRVWEYPISNTQIRNFARYPLKDAVYPKSNIYKQFYSKNTNHSVHIDAGSQATGTLLKIYTNQAFELNGIYTFIFYTNPLPANCHFTLYGNVNGTYKAITTFGSGEGSTIQYCTFQIPADFDNDKANRLYYLDVRLVLNATQATDFDFTLHEYDRLLAKGYVATREGIEVYDPQANKTNLSYVNVANSFGSTASFENYVQSIAADAADYVEYNYRLNITADLANFAAGRYLIKQVTDTGGQNGVVIMVKESGAGAVGTNAIIYISITAGVFAYHPVLAF